VIGAYSFVCAATQLLWLTYAPITTESSHYYGVSTSAIGWLAEIFPLLYVALAIPAGVLLDRWFNPSLAAGGALVAAGALVRLGSQSFAWALAGQALVALAQPVVMSAVSKTAGEYLPAEQRAGGIALGSVGGFAGMLAALIMGPTLGSHGNIHVLLETQAVIAVGAAGLLALMLRRPGSREGEEFTVDGSAARALWRIGAVRTLSGLVFVGFGIFVALSTWLQQLLEPSGVSEKQAGALLVAMVLAGLLGCAIVPALVARANRERSFMAVAVLTASAGCVAVDAFPWLWARGATLAVMGFLLLPALPLVLTRAEELAGAAAGSAGALIWMAGNLGGLVVALGVQALLSHPLAAFLLMAGTALAGLVLVPALGRPDTVGVSRSAPGAAR
jgi:predicted MFS family arabinose efflux permease